MRLLLSVKIGCALLAASLFGSVSHAAPWFPLGPFGGDARSFAVDPADAKHLFLGTATGWIYDSHDGGTTWTRVSQIADRNDLVVDHILADQKRPKRLVAAVWTVGHIDGGVYISEDYGKTWYSQAEMRGQSIRALARAGSDPNELIAGTLKGVFRSMDDGVHWKQISPEGSAEIHEVESIAIDPVDPNIVYAGTWHLPWKTTDGGVTWHNIKEGIIDDSDVFSIIVDPKDSSVVYASACSGIYKSSDSGELFRKVQGIPSAARRTRKLAQDPENLDIVFAGTTEGLYRTLDAGEKWERITPGDVIVNDVYVDPSNSNHVLIATDRGGIFRSEDGGGSFESSNAGFSARQVTAFASDSQNGSTLYVGVVNDKATGGVFESKDGAVHWQQQSDGLGGRDVFSLLSLSDGTLLAGTGHGIFRLADGSWKDSSTLDKSALPPHSAPAKAGVNVKRPVPAGAAHVVDVRLPARKPHTVAPAHAAPKTVKGHPAVRTGTAKPVNRAHGAHLVPVKGKGRPAQQTARGKANPKAGIAPPVRAIDPTTIAPLHTESASVAKQDAKPGRLDSVVYSLVRTEDLLFAGSANGLLRSSDGGQHWTGVASLAMPEVHFVALLPGDKTAPDGGAAPMVLAAGLQRLSLSPDGGATWDTVALPANLTQIGAVGIDGSKNLWVGGREGVWMSTDYGATWKALRNLFVTEVNSIFYDAGQHRVLVTASNSPVAFSVQLPDYKVTYWDTGWRLRFVRPVGDHLVGATLFDGVVVQPQMVDSPIAETARK